MNQDTRERLLRGLRATVDMRIWAMWEYEIVAALTMPAQRLPRMVADTWTWREHADVSLAQVGGPAGGNGAGVGRMMLSLDEAWSMAQAMMRVWWQARRVQLAQRLRWWLGDRWAQRVSRTLPAWRWLWRVLGS